MLTVYYVTGMQSTGHTQPVKLSNVIYRLILRTNN